MIRQRSGIFLLVFSSALAATRAAADPSATDVAAGRKFLTHVETLRADAKIPGLAVVVLRGSETVLATGLGYADMAERRPVTADTPFDIASVTKPISAVVALRLVELGQLDLDRPLGTYDGFAEYRASARAAGGLFFGDFADNPKISLTLRHVLAMTVNGTPGTRFFYNPPVYSWASRPMAQMAKTSFSELTARCVFIPAAMADSARHHRKLPLPAPLAALLAKPYHVAPGGEVVPSEPPAPQGDGAAGGVIATANDLARFDCALTEGKLISAESRKLMWTAGRAPDGRTLPYGLGWFVKEHAGEKLIWHTGLWDGAYSALYLKIPGRNLTLILLANSEGLNWKQRLDEAAVERSPFVTKLLADFPR